jgi:hypothetical protein
MTMSIDGMMPDAPRTWSVWEWRRGRWDGRSWVGGWSEVEPSLTEAEALVGAQRRNGAAAKYGTGRHFMASPATSVPVLDPQEARA